MQLGYLGLKDWTDLWVVLVQYILSDTTWVALQGKNMSSKPLKLTTTRDMNRCHAYIKEAPDLLSSLRSSTGWLPCGLLTAMRTDNLAERSTSDCRMVSPCRQALPFIPNKQQLFNVTQNSSWPAELSALACRCLRWWASSRTRRCPRCSGPRSSGWARPGRWKDETWWNWSPGLQGCFQPWRPWRREQRGTTSASRTKPTVTNEAVEHNYFSKKNICRSPEKTI